MLGSVLGLFTSSNTVVNQYAYLPFGEAQTTSETIANPLRFAGRELDGSTGLYYNNARWYDPSLHRFISEDPIGIEGGMNLYAYVDNDPVNAADPSGLMDCTRRRTGASFKFQGVVTTAWEPYGPWRCDFWGMPVTDYRDLRTVYASICTWRWHCPGDQADDPFNLRPANATERAWIESAISRIRDRPAICARMKESARQMMNHKLRVWDNPVFDDGYLLVGEARWYAKHNAFTLEIYTGPERVGPEGHRRWVTRTSIDPHVVAHEGLHGLQAYMPNVGSVFPHTYMHSDSVPDLHMGMDATAHYCGGE